MCVSQQLQECKEAIRQLTNKIDASRGPEDSKALSEQAMQANIGAISGPAIRTRRILKGHYGKVYAMDWAGDSKHLVSASQDGKLIVWNGFTTNKAMAIPLRSSWVMACSYSPTQKMIACGGLDNTCSVYTVQEDAAEGRTTCELYQHEGYLSCATWVSDQEIITGSGDSTCILWDVEMQKAKTVFNGHLSDVMAIDVDIATNTFISVSVDATAKLWDYRIAGKAAMTFYGHDSDINTVKFFPGGQAFGTGSDDSTCRLFDVRAYQQINCYHDEKIPCGITSLAFSGSGKMIFAGYDDYNCYAWDTVLGEQLEQGPLAGHDDRVSCLGVTKDGKALCTGSWDNCLRIWA